jgi:hypothetical protein
MHEKWYWKFESTSQHTVTEVVASVQYIMTEYLTDGFNVRTNFYHINYTKIICLIYLTPKMGVLSIGENW